jgi:hypothetical protein
MQCDIESLDELRADDGKRQQVQPKEIAPLAEEDRGERRVW